MTLAPATAAMAMQAMGTAMATGTETVGVVEAMAMVTAIEAETEAMATTEAMLLMAMRIGKENATTACKIGVEACARIEAIYRRSGTKVLG